MYEVCKGVRVIEVAAWTFVPAAGAVLADWGADVIKIEHPVTGDPQRGLNNALIPSAGVNPMTEVPNRGKRSVGIDLAHPDGLKLLYQLVEEADVFITSFLPNVRRKLCIDIDDIRERNPRIIYARGTGQGPAGPEADKGGFDLASSWARSGLAHRMTPEGGEPPMQPGSIGDLMGGLTAAGAIAAALYHRERTGEPSVVDVSLYAVGMWMMAQMITGAALGRVPPVLERHRPVNPIVNSYRTSDDRWIWLVMLQADRWWPDLCARVDTEHLLDDPRFATAQTRIEHMAECVAMLEQIFSTRTLAEWCEALDGAEGVWAPGLSPAEVAEDPQALINGYLPDVEIGDGTVYRSVASPAQFDVRPVGRLRSAPEHGQHTEEVLLEFGLSWEDLVELKRTNAIL